MFRSLSSFFLNHTRVHCVKSTNYSLIFLNFYHLNQLLKHTFASTGQLFDSESGSLFAAPNAYLIVLLSNAAITTPQSAHPTYFELIWKKEHFFNLLVLYLPFGTIWPEDHLWSGWLSTIFFGLLFNEFWRYSEWSLSFQVWQIVYWSCMQQSTTGFIKCFFVNDLVSIVVTVFRTICSTDHLTTRCCNLNYCVCWVCFWFIIRFHFFYF